MSNPEKEIILEVGGEGGSLTIVGTLDSEYGWRFSTGSDESILSDILPEEDQDGIEFHRRSNSVGSLDEALGLLDRYPWHRLYPLQIHSEFRQRIYDVVLARYTSEGNEDSYRLKKWEEMCRMN